MPSVSSNGYLQYCEKCRTYYNGDHKCSGYNVDYFYTYPNFNETREIINLLKEILAKLEEIRMEI